LALNSSDVNSLDYHVGGAMMEQYHKLQPKTNTVDELKVKSESLCIWEELLEEHVNKALLDCLTGCQW